MMYESFIDSCSCWIKWTRVAIMWSIKEETFQKIIYRFDSFFLSSELSFDLIQLDGVIDCQQAFVILNDNYSNNCYCD